MSIIRENWCFQNECRECDYSGNDTCDTTSNCMKCTGCLVQPGIEGLSKFLRRGSLGCLTEGCIYNCNNYKKLIANVVGNDNCTAGETVENKMEIVGTTILTGHVKCNPLSSTIYVPSNYITYRQGMARFNLLNNEIPLSLTDQVALWYNIQLLGMEFVPYVSGDAEKADLAFKNNLEWIRCTHNEPEENIQEALRIFGDTYIADNTIKNPNWSPQDKGNAYANELWVRNILTDIETILNSFAIAGPVPFAISRSLDCNSPKVAGRDVTRVISDFGLLRKYFTRGGVSGEGSADYGSASGGFRFYDRDTYAAPTIDSFPKSGFIILPPKEQDPFNPPPPPRFDLDDDPIIFPIVPRPLVPLGEPYKHTLGSFSNYELRNAKTLPNAGTEAIDYRPVITASICGDNNIGCGGTGNCTCKNGYSGDTCEIKPIGCFSNTCKNGGTCTQTNLNGDFICDCKSGFKGQICQINKGCEPNPCQNDTECIEGPGNHEYTCVCPSGLTGTNCETSVDLCTSQPCQNGATCSSDALGYTCECVPGFTGTNCETNVDDCDGHTCLNESTCVDGVNGYTCGPCPTGFTGAFCGNTAAAPTFESCPDINNAYTTLNIPLTDSDILDIKTEIITNGKTLDQLSCKYGPVELWNVKNVTNMNGLFSNIGKTNKIESLDLTKWDVSKCTSMNGMFSGAVIGSLNLKKWRTIKLENTIGMFQNAKIDDVDLDAWDMQTSKNTSFMFYGLVATNLRVNWANSFFSIANQMFSKCWIGTIDGIGGWITNGLNQANYMFSESRINSQLYLNAERGSWDLLNLQSAAFMFSNSNIDSVIANYWNLRYIKDTSFMFSGATMNKLEMNYWTVAVSENGWKNTGGKSPNWKQSIEGGAEMFNMFNGSTIKTISCYNFTCPAVSNLNFVFKGVTCSEILDVRNWNVPNVNNFFQTFNGMDVGSFYLYNWAKSNVTSGGVQMFQTFAAANNSNSIILLDGFANPRKETGLKIPLKANEVNNGSIGLTFSLSPFSSPFMFQNAKLGMSEVDISSWRGLDDSDIFSMFNGAVISTLVLPSDKGSGLTLTGGTFSNDSPAAVCKTPVSFCPA